MRPIERYHMTREGRPRQAVAVSIVAPRRAANRERRALQVGALVTVLVSVLLGACAVPEVLRPVEPSSVRPGGPLRRADVLAVGERVPDFVAPALGGGVVRWRDRDGAPTVLVVWASWCPHCQRLLPSLVRVAQDYPDVRLLSVTTAIGRNGGPSPAEVVARGPAFPVALDDADNTLARGLGVFRYPTVYWVGRDGTVRNVSEGEASEADLRRAFDLLAASM
jgi:thiol-disulfide isomerase/thioredoxin